MFYLKKNWTSKAFFCRQRIGFLNLIETATTITKIVFYVESENSSLGISQNKPYFQSSAGQWQNPRPIVLVLLNRVTHPV